MRNSKIVFRLTLFFAFLSYLLTGFAAEPNPNCLPQNTPAFTLKPNQTICLNAPARINMITCEAPHLSAFLNKQYVLQIQQNYYGSAIIPVTRFKQNLNEHQQRFHFSGTLSEDIQVLSFNLDPSSAQTAITLRCKYYR